MGIFAELSILPSKYKPAKCESIFNLLPSFGINCMCGDGVFKAFCRSHQHSQGQQGYREGSPVARACPFIYEFVGIFFFHVWLMGLSRITLPLLWWSALLMLGSTTNSRTLFFALLTSRCKWISQWIRSLLIFHNSYYKVVTFLPPRTHTLDRPPYCSHSLNWSQPCCSNVQIDRIPLICSYLIAVQQVCSRFHTCMYMCLHWLFFIVQSWSS